MDDSKGRTRQPTAGNRQGVTGDSSSCTCVGVLSTSADHFVACILTAPDVQNPEARPKTANKASRAGSNSFYFWPIWAKHTKNSTRHEFFSIFGRASVFFATGSGRLLYSLYVDLGFSHIGGNLALYRISILVLIVEQMHGSRVEVVGRTLNPAQGFRECSRFVAAAGWEVEEPTQKQGHSQWVSFC